MDAQLVQLDLRVLRIQRVHIVDHDEHVWRRCELHAPNGTDPVLVFDLDVYGDPPHVSNSQIHDRCRLDPRMDGRRGPVRSFVGPRGTIESVSERVGILVVRWDPKRLRDRFYEFARSRRYREMV